MKRYLYSLLSAIFLTLSGFSAWQNKGEIVWGGALFLAVIFLMFASIKKERLESVPTNTSEEIYDTRPHVYASLGLITFTGIFFAVMTWAWTKVILVSVSILLLYIVIKVCFDKKAYPEAGVELEQL